jgi:hypothetical protein
VPRNNKPSSIPAADTEEQRKFFRLNLRSHMMLLFLLALYAGPYKSVRATLVGWSTMIRAEVAAEYNDSATNDCAIARAQVNTALPHDGVRILFSAHVHGITNPAHYPRNLVRQQQAEEAERGQHLEKQLTRAAGFLDVRAQVGRPTKEEDVKQYLRIMAVSAGGEGDHYTLSMRALSKNEAILTAEDELV